jgi:cell division ATPase FtsA
MVAEDNTDLSKIVTARQIPDDLREEIEEMFDDGSKPTVIASEFGIPIKIARSIKREMRRAEREGDTAEKPTAAPVVKTTQNTTQSVDMLTQVMQLRKDQLAMDMLEAQISQMQQDHTHRQRMRDLELRERELDIEEREAELTDEEPNNPVVDAAASQLFPNSQSGEYGVFRDILQFATATKQKESRAQPMTTPTPTPTTTPDFSKPLSKEQVDAEIKKFEASHGRAAIVQASNFPAAIESKLKETYPTILPENINTINAAIKAYVNNAQ